MTRPPEAPTGLSVERLVAEAGLSLAAGDGAAAARVRWVHITELTDPTPWLSGGELVLTTGLQLHDAAEQRGFVERLKDHAATGLGFGTGFTHETVPRALVEAATEHELPLFEIPYPVPFIALTEAAFTQIVNEGYETLRRGAEIHRHLERLVLEEQGLDELARAIADAIGGAVLMLDGRGEAIASSASSAELPAATLEALSGETAARSREDGAGASAFEPNHEEVRGRALALPVTTRSGQAPQAWLVALPSPETGAGAGGPLDEFARLILQQAVTVVALELMRLRVARDTERRLAGDILAEALTGKLDADELARRLAPFGLSATAVVAVFSLDDPTAGEQTLAEVVAPEGHGALVATRGPFLCAVLDGADVDSERIAAEAREALAARVGPARAAVSRAAPVAQLRRSFHEARCALEVHAVANGNAPDVATHRDLGAFELLLSLQDDEALRLYCDNLLEPLEQSGGDYGDQLVRSLEAFIEHNGQWERAARQLYCHRHTLRYRIQRIEALTGRDLGRARDRIEFWLALRGRELIG